MKIFILTVSLNDVVEEIDAFDTFEEAQTRADEIALERGVARQLPAHSSKMNGWILYDEKPLTSNGYETLFITAVVRDIKHKAIAKTDVTYDSIIDKLKDLVTTPVVSANPILTVSQQPKDDFFDLSLPGGFSLKDKALTMKEVSANPHDVKSIYNLSKRQKWALTTSRIQKRPAFMCLVPAYGVFTQRYALEELEKRSVVGEKLVELEMLHLEAVYENEKKPSWQDDEESSSSEEDDGSYNYRY
jgi:hypothetical protein